MKKLSLALCGLSLTLASFGSLAVSSHRGTSSMGELLTIAIAFTLISTLIVLPALMSVMGRDTR